jgi:hypothetical protein
LVKPGKDPQNPESYIPVTLLNHLRKLYKRCIYQQIYPVLAKKLATTEFGFVQKRNTIDGVMYLDLLQKQYRTKQPCIALLDVKSAYDTVDRQILWKKLLVQYNNKLSHAIIALFDQNSISVISNNTCSRNVQLQRGLTKGSVMAPILYNVFINDINTILKHKKNTTIKIGQNKYPAHIIQFADYLAIFAPNETHLNLLNKCMEHSRINNYQYNVKKAVV